MTGTMTYKQVRFLRSLVSERLASTLVDLWNVTEDEAVSRFVDSVESKAEASRLIDELLAMPKPNGDARSRHVEPPEGIHYLRDGESITVYKVQRAVHGSGNLYAKRLDPDGDKPSWEYVGRGGAFRDLSDETLLDLDTARQFGLLYGVCGVCGRTLTDETSIERGIGPVCATRFDRLG